MFDTNTKMSFSMTNIDGKIDAHISVKDLIDEMEYEASASGENTEEVLTNLYSNLIDDIESQEFDDMDEESYIDYLESKVEELEAENYYLKLNSDMKNTKNNTVKYKDLLLEEFLSRYDKYYRN